MVIQRINDNKAQTDSLLRMTDRNSSVDEYGCVSGSQYRYDNEVLFLFGSSCGHTPSIHPSSIMTSENSEKDVHPPIFGGCICKNVCYTVNFPAGTKFPPFEPHICQCTDCRKGTGGLVNHFLVLPRKSVTFTSESTLAEFSKLEGRYRGYCTNCGSSLYWRSDNVFEIIVGSLDQDVLLGEDGPILCTPRLGTFWSKYQIPGVTTPEGYFGGGPGLTRKR